MWLSELTLGGIFIFYTVLNMNENTPTDLMENVCESYYITVYGVLNYKIFHGLLIVKPFVNVHANTVFHFLEQIHLCYIPINVPNSKNKLSCVHSGGLLSCVEHCNSTKLWQVVRSKWSFTDSLLTFIRLFIAMWLIELMNVLHQAGKLFLLKEKKSLKKDNISSLEFCRNYGAIPNEVMFSSQAQKQS